MKFNKYILIYLSSLSLNIFSLDNNEYVITSSGKVKGYLENKVINYDDIPYAMPPVGDLRWKAPREISNSKLR